MSQKEKTVKIIDDYFEIDWLNYIAKLFKQQDQYHVVLLFPMLKNFQWYQ